MEIEKQSRLESSQEKLQMKEKRAITEFLPEDLWCQIFKGRTGWNIERKDQLSLKLVCRSFLHILDELQNGYYTFTVYCPGGVERPRETEKLLACAKYIERRNTALRSICLNLGLLCPPSLAADRVLDAIAACQKLERLRLSKFEYDTPLVIPCLPESLTCLHLESETSPVWKPVAATTVLNMSALVNLKMLKLHYSLPEQMNQVAKLTLLEELYIDCIYVDSSKDLIAVTRLINLKSIALWRLDRIDTLLQNILASLPKLESVRLLEVSCIDDGLNLDILKSCKSAETLNLVITAEQCSISGFRQAAYESGRLIQNLEIYDRDSMLVDIPQPIDWPSITVPKLNLWGIPKFTMDWLYFFDTPVLRSLELQAYEFVFQNMQALLDIPQRLLKEWSISFSLYDSPQGFEESVRTDLEMLGFIVSRSGDEWEATYNAYNYDLDP